MQFVRSPPTPLARTFQDFFPGFRVLSQILLSPLPYAPREPWGTCSSRMALPGSWGAEVAGWPEWVGLDGWSGGWKNRTFQAEMLAVCGGREPRLAEQKVGGPGRSGSFFPFDFGDVLYL